jgi:hypothetical protein
LYIFVPIFNLEQYIKATWIMQMFFRLKWLMEQPETEFNAWANQDYKEQMEIYKKTSTILRLAESALASNIAMQELLTSRLMAIDNDLNRTKQELAKLSKPDEQSLLRVVREPPYLKFQFYSNGPVAPANLYNSEDVERKTIREIIEPFDDCNYSLKTGTTEEIKRLQTEIQRESTKSNSRLDDNFWEWISRMVFLLLLQINRPVRLCKEFHAEQQRKCRDLEQLTESDIKIIEKLSRQGKTWQDIASEIGVRHLLTKRGYSALDCFKAYKTKAQSLSQSIRVPESVSCKIPKLEMYYADCMNQWDLIATHFDGYTAEQLRNSQKTGHWTRQEDSALLSAIAKHGTNWKKVAASVTKRTARQCKERFLRKHQPGMQTTKFSRAELEKLKLMVAKHGTDWALIQEEFPGRSRTQLHEQFKYQKKKANLNKT